jgi:hypothetical protein
MSLRNANVKVLWIVRDVRSADRIVHPHDARRICWSSIAAVGAFAAAFAAGRALDVSHGVGVQGGSSV